MSDAFPVTQHLHLFLCCVFSNLGISSQTSNVSGIYEQEDILMQRSRMIVDVQTYIH